MDVQTHLIRSIWAGVVIMAMFAFGFALIYFADRHERRQNAETASDQSELRKLSADD